MPYSFRSEQWLPYPVETVFAFFADPENLPALVPPALCARLERTALVPPTRVNGASYPSSVAGAGSQIVLSLRALPLVPVRVRLHAEIIGFEANRSFCDCQIRGPFAFWQHNHRFRALDRNVTILTDEIEYDLPLGLLGRLAHALFVRRQIEAAFTFRRERILQTLARITQEQPSTKAQESRVS